MMRLIAIYLFLVFFLSCKTSYVQLVDTSSKETKIENGTHVFQNDSLIITYHFWARNGKMAFTIYNKLNKPLYIDWKKSSFIVNSTKFDYWVDGQLSKSILHFGSYYFDEELYEQGIIGSVSGGGIETVTVKIERITFIPPESNYSMSQFYLMPDLYVELNAKTNFIEEKRNDRTKKTTKVYEKMYLKESSPLTFRNFLTFSNFEDFSQEFHIDNAFYISKIKEMDTRHFSYDKLVDVGKRKEYYRNTKDPAIRFTPFKRDASFYIFIPEEGSVEYRKKKLK